MKHQCFKTWMLCITTALISFQHVSADDTVDEALKGRDMNTIMDLLTVKQAEAPAGESRAAKNVAAKQQPKEEDLKALRERLAAELQAAREEARRAGLNVDAAPANTVEKSRTFPAADPAVAATAPAAKTAKVKEEPEAPKRNKGIFNRIFSSKSETPTVTESAPATESNPAPAELAQLTAPVREPVRAPAAAVKRPVKPAPAAPAPAIKTTPAITTPPTAETVAAPSETATAIAAIPKPSIPTPAVRTQQPDISGVRNSFGPRQGTVRQNRDALDALVKQSRNDIVNMAMSQASGAADNNPEPAIDPDAWKKAGPNAWKYNGEWQAGTMHGQGRMTFADGWEYVGMWHNGLMHGQGTIVYPDGTSYEGQWRNGRMEGYGTLTYADGWKFIGQWLNGKINGQGTLVNPGQ